MSLTFDSPYGPLPYFDHPHNTTRANERAVEIPLALDFIRQQPQGAAGLEVGDVLSHYVDRPWWDVVDKYETADHVQRLDVLDIDRPYDWAASISTIEHVGWDEKPIDEGKAIAALHHLETLATHLLVTVPTGYHPRLDHALPEPTVFYRRGPDDTWTPAPYEPLTAYPNGLWVLCR